MLRLGSYYNQTVYQMVATVEDKPFCVFGCARTQSVISVIREFRTKFIKDPSRRNCIVHWV